MPIQAGNLRSRLEITRFAAGAFAVVGGAWAAVGAAGQRPSTLASDEERTAARKLLVRSGIDIAEMDVVRVTHGPENGSRWRVLAVDRSVPGEITLTVGGAWTHTVELRRRETSGANARGRRASTWASVAAGVPAILVVTAGALEEPTEGARPMRRAVALLPPGTDVIATDQVVVTAGAAPPAWAVRAVLADAADWGLTVELETIPEEAP